MSQNQPSNIDGKMIFSGHPEEGILVVSQNAQEDDERAKYDQARVYPMCEGGEEMKLVEVPEEGIYAFQCQCDWEKCETTPISLVVE